MEEDQANRLNDEIATALRRAGYAASFTAVALLLVAISTCANLYQLRQAGEMFKRDKAASIVVSNLRQDAPVAGQPFTWHVELTNVGHTLGKHVYIEFVSRVVEPNYDEGELRGQLSRQTGGLVRSDKPDLPPSLPCSIQVETGEPLSDALIQEIASGQKKVILYGLVYYDDVWDDSNTSSFFFKYDPKEKPPALGLRNGIWYPEP